MNYYRYYVHNQYIHLKYILKIYAKCYLSAILAVRLLYYLKRFRLSNKMKSYDLLGIDK